MRAELSRSRRLCGLMICLSAHKNINQQALCDQFIEIERVTNEITTKKFLPGTRSITGYYLKKWCRDKSFLMKGNYYGNI